MASGERSDSGLDLVCRVRDGFIRHCGIEGHINEQRAMNKEQGAKRKEEVWNEGVLARGGCGVFKRRNSAWRYFSHDIFL
jgi:hypothetical protein